MLTAPQARALRAMVDDGGEASRDDGANHYTVSGVRVSEVDMSAMAMDGLVRWEPTLPGEYLMRTVTEEGRAALAEWEANHGRAA